MSKEISEPQPESWADVREIYVESMEPRAEKIMNDERLRFFRTLVRRRILASLIIFAALGTAIEFYIPEEMNIPTGFLGPHLLLWLFGNRVARGFTELPVELLDERLVARRHESYKYAFYILLGAIPLLFIAIGLCKKFFGPDLTDSFHEFVGLWLPVVSLPTAVFLWREPEL